DGGRGTPPPPACAGILRGKRRADAACPFRRALCLPHRRTRRFLHAALSAGLIPPRETRGMTLSKEIVEAARQVSTATFTTVMLKKGLRHTWMSGTAPINPGQKRTGGRAFTLRFLP